MISYYSSEISDLVDSFKQRVREASREGDVRDALFQLRDKLADVSTDYKQRFYAGLQICREAWPQSTKGPYRDTLSQLRDEVANLSADYKQQFYAGLKDCQKGAWPQSSDGPYVLGFEATVFADKQLR